jgi:hypothetical protein
MSADHHKADFEASGAALDGLTTAAASRGSYPSPSSTHADEENRCRPAY